MAKTGESYAAALRHLRRTEEAHMSAYQLSHAGVTVTGQVRLTNEDRFLAEGELIAVADGMGGHASGDLASRLAVETLQEVFAADTTAEGLARAVQAANQVIWERAEADPLVRGMGTTVAAAARVAIGGEERLAIANVGDSRAYRLREGRLERLSSDHSLVADLVRAGELTEDQARDHPNRNILTRALGVGPEIEAHLVDTDLARDDRLLLCSDGLFNELTDDEIVEVLGSVAGPDAAAAELVQRANDHGGHDNITAVVADIR
jgi:protein phosphatase